MSQSFHMRSLNPSNKTDSLHSSSASSRDFSDSLPHPLRNEKTPNNGAAENRSGRLRSVTACASASGASADSGRFSCASPLGTGCASPPPPSAVSELESLGDFAHLLRAMSASEDTPSSMPSTNLHGLKTSSSESIASPTVQPSVASHLIRSRRLQDCQSRVPGESESILTRSLSRGAHVQTLERAAAPSVSTGRRLLAFLRCVRFTEPQLSRHSRSSIHRESGRCSRNSFRASVLNPMKSPNHALQRTAPRVTVAAISSSDPSRPSHLFP